ncbi:MAG: hypothetical protein JNM52_00215 [Betaproteobacteria bacterium]|nr:hypothetical protein [Betaproteobacteria bacterium]
MGDAEKGLINCAPLWSLRDAVSAAIFFRDLLDLQPYGSVFGLGEGDPRLRDSYRAALANLSMAEAELALLEAEGFL